MKLIKDLSLTSQKQYQLLSDEAKFYIKKQYKKKRKSLFLAYLCWIMIGMHYGYMRKWSTQMIYWVTGAGFFVWMFIDMFRIPGIVNAHNEELLEDIIMKLKMYES